MHAFMVCLMRYHQYVTWVYILHEPAASKPCLDHSNGYPLLLKQRLPCLRCSIRVQAIESLGCHSTVTCIYTCKHAPSQDRAGLG